MTATAALATFSRYGTPVASASFATSTYAVKWLMVMCCRRLAAEVDVARKAQT